jgi:hypothetical protein
VLSRLNVTTFTTKAVRCRSLLEQNGLEQLTAGVVYLSLDL